MTALHRHASGATRSADANAVRYDLIPPGPLRRLAARYALGAATHGDRNWEYGLPWGDTYNHLMRHLELWRASVIAGKPDADDHLAAAAWGCFALMFFERRSFWRTTRVGVDVAPRLPWWRRVVAAVGIS